MPSSLIDRVLSGVLSIAAIGVAAGVIHRDFFSAADAVATINQAPIAEAAWHDALPVGIRVGDTSARVTMVIFNDLECPACRAFHRTTLDIQREFGNRVSVVYVHFPLGGHRFAVPAAQAAECADAQGRFAQFVDAVFAKQDSIGFRGWGAYAQDAGIRDTAAVAECSKNPTLAHRIVAGRDLALRWELHGTPTIILNGERYPMPPSEGELRQAIQHLLKGPSVAVAGQVAGAAITAVGEGSRK